jgi:twitching motility protein PilT
MMNIVEHQEESLEPSTKVIEILIEMLNSEKVYSEIRFESESPVMIKTASGWIDADVILDVTHEDISDFLESLDTNWREHIKQGSLNRPLDLTSWRLRINGYLAFGGKKLMLSIRKIKKKVPTITEVGLPNTMRILLENPSGLILFSGPTGSGKTTSIAAMVEAINGERNAHILTIEDPIEYLHTPNKSIFSQREIGVDCESFSKAVKDAMRQSPEVIVIGEILDKETAEQALIAGESGHLVLGTLHASSAAGTVGKFLGFFNADEYDSKLNALQGSLVAIINQTLIPRKDGNGQALAVDFMANHKRTYSKILNEADKINMAMARKDDGDLSISLSDSVAKLVSADVVDKAAAARSIINNTVAYEKMKNM